MDLIKAFIRAVRMKKSISKRDVNYHKQNTYKQNTHNTLGLDAHHLHYFLVRSDVQHRHIVVVNLVSSHRARRR